MWIKLSCCQIPVAVRKGKDAGCGSRSCTQFEPFYFIDLIYVNFELWVRELHGLVSWKQCEKTSNTHLSVSPQCPLPGTTLKIRIVPRPSTAPSCPRLLVRPGSPTSTGHVCPAAHPTPPSWEICPMMSLKSPSNSSSGASRWDGCSPVFRINMLSDEYSWAYNVS